MTSDLYFNQLLNDLCIELSFRAFQKQMTMNSVCPHCNQQCENIRNLHTFIIFVLYFCVDERPGLDIYGNRIDSNGGVLSQSAASSLSSTNTESASQPTTTTTNNNGMLTVECPCCKKVLAATRFAPHLEKCMGMGRQSARKRYIIDQARVYLFINIFRGNLMMKMAAGSENESDDASEIVTRTPALPTNEENFSQASSAASASKTSNVIVVNETKKVKVSPNKSKSATTTATTTTTTSNSKSSSPSKNIKKASNTPSKGKSVNTKK